MPRVEEGAIGEGLVGPSSANDTTVTRLRKALRNFVPLMYFERRGWVLSPPGVRYNQDGLISVHSTEFMTDPRFLKAYARGVRAAGEDYQWHWRVHVGLWASYHAVKLEGDFVECGVNRGALSSAILDYLNWNELDRRFPIGAGRPGRNLERTRERGLGCRWHLQSG